MLRLHRDKPKLRAFGRCRFRTLRAFRRREDGAAAVEFGLVLAPFLGMLFAILETALVFFAGQTLETAVADASRLILTGQAQTSGFSQQQFKERVCKNEDGSQRAVFGLFDCMGNLVVDVQKYTSFSGADLSRPVDSTTGQVKPGVYNPGGPCEIVVVRLIYEFPVYLSFMGFDLADTSNGTKRLLVATSVFRNEPYQGTCS
jgi:Flp pilus assembly protein TadG